jgi:hypothetical protein
MRPWTLPILGTIALSLAVPSHAAPRTELGPAAERTASAFWPDAAADLVAYVFFPRGKDDRFWAYGFGRIMDAAFAAPDEQRSVRRRPILTTDASAAPPAKAAELAAGSELCGDGPAAGNADALIERIEQAIRPSASQRDVLEQLRTALLQASERINSACPRTAPATFTERLKAIQDRIWAMRDALLTIRLPLEKFYDSLTHEQHWRLHRSEPDAGETGARIADMRAQTCAEPVAGFARGPMRAVERALRPNERQRASFETLRLRSAGMAQLIGSACPNYPLLGHMGRFEAVTDRLDVMLFAVMTMSPVLEEFYESLDDKQRTALERALRQIKRSSAAGAGM